MGDLALMLQQRMGPPAPPEYRPRPLVGRIEPEREDLSDLWPLLVAMGLDILSTETGVRPGETRISSHGVPITGAESNPLPGMGSPVGRIAWGAAEALAFDRLTRGASQRRRLRDALAAIHGSTALSNFAINREAQ